ncbi:MAG: IS66 family transposase [Ignavibacteriales bacterium]
MRSQPGIEQRQHQVITRLTNENAKLRTQIAALEKENALLKTQLQQIMIQLEELKIKVFGRKHKDQPTENDGSQPKPPAVLPRPPQSYRRPVPKEEEITETKQFEITVCTNCHTPLNDLKVITRYEEDIVPPTKWHQVLKKVEKQLITTGYCPNCRKRRSAIAVAQHLVTLGTNIKQFIAYANVILRLSFEQTRAFLKDAVGLCISDGEISNILEEQSQLLYPHFTQLKQTIDQQPGAHYDETSWDVQEEEHRSWCWVKIGTQAPDTLFILGRSRGKGNAEELRGTANDEQFGISDDYGAYQNLFLHHQLCWVHPLRKLRELKDSEYLTDGQQKHCRQIYESFADLYAEVRKTIDSPFVLEERLEKRGELLRRFTEITAAHIRDPVRLQRIKKRLCERKAAYFTCVIKPHIPADNNKAERALRHVVLKRKNSYGSKTQKGAEVMSILFSVLLSLWWRRPKNFFESYSHLVNSVLP